MQTGISCTLAIQTVLFKENVLRRVIPLAVASASRYKTANRKSEARMNQTDLLEQEPVFQLKGGMLAVTTLELSRNDPERLDQQLAEKVQLAPNFFHDTPLILALDKLPQAEGPVDLAVIMDICRLHGLSTMALRAEREEDIATAHRLGVLVLPPLPSVERVIKTDESSAASDDQGSDPGLDGEDLDLAEMPVERIIQTVIEKVPEYFPAKIITQPVRGGMQIYAPHADLIVLAPVSAGAELLADGNIHVYAPLRGRALAGIKGNTQARIFCQQLAAELVSIAGNYKVAEDLRRSPQWGRSVQINLSGEMLNITRL